MIGMHLKDPSSGITGKVDAEKVWADGKVSVRIRDRWLDADGLVAA